MMSVTCFFPQEETIATDTPTKINAVVSHCCHGHVHLVTAPMRSCMTIGIGGTASN